eukprot:s2688_g6.t1
MEGGERMQADRQRQIWRDNLQRLQQDHFCIEGADLPSLCDLEAAFRRINPAKATGPDLLHPAIFKAAPAQLARKTFCQLMKLSTHGQEALEHKGGFLCPLWKSKGAKHDPSSYRSILVSSFLGKSLLHRSLRDSQCHLFENFLQQEQLGGRRHVPVTLGVHIGRAFLRSRSSTGACVGMVFLDLKEAFYRIVRQLTLGGDVSDGLLAKICARLGLPADSLADFHRLLQQPEALVAANVPGHVRNAIRAVHSDTFFQVRGQQDCCRTELGTRPGDSWADVVFSYLWSRILKQLQQHLDQLGLGEEIPERHGLCLCASAARTDDSPLTFRSFLGPTWMDDTCICTSATTATALEQKLGQISSLLLQFCYQHALCPNLQPGKTEIFMSLRGVGSRRVKEKYFGPSSGRCMWIACENGFKTIQVVSSYTHLGCVMHHRDDNRREARKRFAVAQTTFTQHRKYLLQNQMLPFLRRRELFASLVLSKLSYGAESWTFRDQGTKSYVHSALIRLYRRLLAHKGIDHCTDEDILVECGLNSPTEILRVARLRYLSTLYNCASAVPWGLLQSDAEWIRLIEDDLRWMHAQLHHASHLPDPAHQFGAWEHLLRFHRSYWKRLVRRAAAHACSQRRNRHLVQTFHADFVSDIQKARPDLPGFSRPRALQASPEEIFACMQCCKCFRSKGGLGAHNFKKHQQVASVRRLFDSTHCGACLKEYFTTAKLKSHLLRSDICRRTLISRRCVVSPVPGAGSSIDGQQALRHDGILHPLQGAGPSLPPVPLVEDLDYDLGLIEEIYLALIENDTASTTTSLVSAVITSRAVSWTLCRRSLARMEQDLSDEDVAVLRDLHQDLRAVLLRLQDPGAWPFLRQVEVFYTEAPIDLEHYEEQLDFWTTCPTSSRLWTIPRPMSKDRFLIHAFSGRRRVGDFQYFLDALQTQHAGATIHTISLDIVINEQYGNVASEPVRAFWLRGVRERGVIGLLAGPPCESWSQARGRECSDQPLNKRPGRRMPRVVRDREALWGKICLALRELEQTHTGNLLLLYTLQLLLHLAIAGGVGVLEHPAIPKDEELASIWHLPILRLMCSWPDFSYIELAQGLWGAFSRKPTGLLLLNVPDMIPQLRRWQVATDVPQGVAIGRSEDGSWKTSQLKEYPPSLCAGLAHGFFHSLQRHPIAEEVGVLEIVSLLAYNAFIILGLFRVSVQIAWSQESPGRDPGRRHRKQVQAQKIGRLSVLEGLCQLSEEGAWRGVAASTSPKTSKLGGSY